MAPPARRLNPNLRTADLLAKGRMFAGQVKRSAQVVSKKRISFAKKRLTEAKERFIPTGSIEEAQRIAEMKRVAKARFNEERLLRARFSLEFNQIQQELRTIIRLIKEKQGIKGQLFIENQALIERFSMNILKQPRPLEFALNKNPQNKQAMVKMLLFTERDLANRKLNPAKASKNFIASEQIESVIENNISQVIEEMNQ